MKYDVDELRGGRKLSRTNTSSVPPPLLPPPQEFVLAFMTDRKCDAERAFAGIVPFFIPIDSEDSATRVPLHR